MITDNTTNVANKKKSSSQLFRELALTIKEAYNNDNSFDHKINDHEATKVALNLVGFCKRFIEIQIRIEKEAEKHLKPG